MYIKNLIMVCGFLILIFAANPTCYGLNYNSKRIVLRKEKKHLVNFSFISFAEKSPIKHNNAHA